MIAGDRPTANDASARSLAIYREQGDERGTAVMLHRVGVGEFYAGNHAVARELAEEALELDRRFGSKSGEAQALSLVAELEWHAGERDHAFELLHESIRLARESGFRWWEANLLGGVAEWSLELDRVSDAEAAVRRELELRLAMDDRHAIVYPLATVAVIAGGRGQGKLAGLVWGAVEAEDALRPAAMSEELRAFVAPVLAAATPEFEAGRREGGRLTPEEAAELALAAIDG
jgi:hypothetical protein